MRSFALLLLVLFVSLCSCRRDEREAYVEALLSKMTLDEKCGQLCCPIGFDIYERVDDSCFVFTDSFMSLMDTMPPGALWAVMRADPWSRKTVETGLDRRSSVRLINMLQRYAVENTRLGIPLLIAEEAAHGHMAVEGTVFPTGIAQASTWNKELLYDMGVAIGEELMMRGAHIGYGPVIDVARDPRWSRVEETFGEDPYLTAELGASVALGLQQNATSTLKHMVAYGMPEGGHNGATAHLGQTTLRSDYLYPFEVSVRRGVGSVMTSYNAIDGVPCTSNAWLLNTVLRDEWGFEGVVFSDLNSIAGMVSTHRTAASHVEAAAQAINAGVDVDLGGYSYGMGLKKAVEQGLVSLEVLDDAVRRVLLMKYDKGLFENPYIEEEKAAETLDAHKELSKEVARQGVVLLKNDGILPLRDDLSHIAVIGPNADNIYNQLGDYTAPQRDDEVVTILEGIRSHVSSATMVSYVKGCSIRATDDAEIDKAVEAALKADVAVVVVGGSSARDFATSYEDTGAASVQPSLSDMENGEGYDRCDLVLLGLQNELLTRVAQTGTPMVVVFIEGRPMLKNCAVDLADAVVTAWYPGSYGGDAVAEVLLGEYNPAGRLPISIPHSVGQLPVYYSQGKIGDYVTAPAEAYYPFGYGLSYTTFEYGGLRIEPIDSPSSDYTSGRRLYEVSLWVENIGGCDGDEVVQLYLRDEVASIAPPAMRLRAFDRVSLRRGERKDVSFILTESDFAMVDKEGRWCVEPGDFTIMIGASSKDIRLDTIVSVCY